jgi:hypothetical protein
MLAPFTSTKDESQISAEGNRLRFSLPRKWSRISKCLRRDLSASSPAGEAYDRLQLEPGDYRGSCVGQPCYLCIENFLRDRRLIRFCLAACARIAVPMGGTSFSITMMSGQYSSCLPQFRRAGRRAFAEPSGARVDICSCCRRSPIASAAQRGLARSRRCAARLQLRPPSRASFARLRAAEGSSASRTLALITSAARRASASPSPTPTSKRRRSPSWPRMFRDQDLTPDAVARRRRPGTRPSVSSVRSFGRKFSTCFAVSGGTRFGISGSMGVPNSPRHYGTS